MLHFAVEIPQVKHVLLVGHYGCGGIVAAFDGLRLGVSTTGCSMCATPSKVTAPVWPRSNNAEAKPAARAELHVAEQVIHVVARTTVVQERVGAGATQHHSRRVYGIEDGLLRTLDIDLPGQMMSTVTQPVP